MGRLEGSVAAIETRIAGIEAGQREAAERSTREHAEVRRDFRSAVDRIEAALSGRLNHHAEEIDDLQESRAQLRGVLRLIVVICAVAGAAGAMAGVLAAAAGVL